MRYLDIYKDIEWEALHCVLDLKDSEFEDRVDDLVKESQGKRYGIVVFILCFDVICSVLILYDAVNWNGFMMYLDN